MKYSAKQTTKGRWVVAKGSKIISDSFETKAEAHELAVVRSMLWHHKQSMALWNELTKGEGTATMLDGTVNELGDFYM
jgi:hypothetical protein|tara:strand:+ start:51 stop:284 length:234 start_codon:yes stop_codon:yes gene_type:complete